MIMSKINELTILETVEGLKNSDFTSVEVTESCLDQIKKYDEKIKAFITVTKDIALKQAKAADALIKKEGKKAFEEKPLLGVPYACKDNFNTEEIETTAGSNILKGYIPPYESTVTKRLKDAGAVLLGKTNMDAFAHGASTETSDFFPTHNPWDYSKVPGGSSGGSAAAVSSDMCIFAMGSDTGGSIRCPASWCGVTGLKPSYGRVSRYGLIAMASSTDSPGPMTKTVYDNSYVLNIIAGKDPLDATTSTKKVDNYIKNIEEFSIKNLKIGKPKSYFNINFDPGIKEILEESLRIFEKNGAEIVDIELIDPKYAIALYTILQRSEVSSNLARFDGIRYGQKRDKFGFEARKRMMLGAYSLSAGYYDEYYKKGQKVRTLVVNDFNKAFEKVDVIVGPTMPSTAIKIGESEKFPFFGEMTDMMQIPGSMAGLSVISIPCGLSKKMPVGLQLIGPMFSESVILGAANKFQEVTSYHKEKPKLV